MIFIFSFFLFFSFFSVIGYGLAFNRLFDLKFDDLNFHIIGSGPLKSDILKRSSINVILYDHVNNSEISNILINMDLNILLSKSEGFPKVILEAAAASVPSIVYNN